MGEESGRSACEAAMTELERAAIAAASGMYRDHIKGNGPLAEASRRLVIEEAVLRLCPTA